MRIRIIKAADSTGRYGLRSDSARPNSKQETSVVMRAWLGRTDEQRFLFGLFGLVAQIGQSVRGALLRVR
jgi:hypothetical protein